MIAIKSMAKNVKKNKAIGQFRVKDDLIAAISISSIITTKRNNTATAPTYTMTSVNAKNSAPRSTNNPAALQNEKISQSTE